MTEEAVKKSDATITTDASFNNGKYFEGIRVCASILEGA